MSIFGKRVVCVKRRKAKSKVLDTKHFLSWCYLSKGVDNHRVTTLSKGSESIPLSVSKDKGLFKFSVSLFVT